MFKNSVKFIGRSSFKSQVMGIQIILIMIAQRLEDQLKKFIMAEPSNLKGPK